MKQEKNVSRNKKEESDMSIAIDTERPCSIAESVKQSCKEVKLMREGMVPKRSWDDFCKKTKREMENK